MISHNSMVDVWMPMIRGHARHAFNATSVLDTEDLEQIGAMAAVRAMDKYDASEGMSLEAYVSFLVRQAIHNEAGRFCGIFRISHTTMSIGAEANKLVNSGKTIAEATQLINDRRNLAHSEENISFAYETYKNRVVEKVKYEPESITLTEESIMNFLEGNIKSPIEKDIVYEKWLGTNGVDSISSKFNISKKKVRAIERELRLRIEGAINEL